MSESVEAVFAVVVSHAALSDSAEGELARRKMHYHVIDAASSESQCVENLFLHALVLTEKIEGEW